MSKITVAIPTYNRELELNECLLSVLNQTEKDINIIIFDNGSEYDIEVSVAKIDPLNHIKILKNEKNLGSIENFKRIKDYDFDSEYVIIFHDDDTMHPEYLKSAITFLDKNKNIVWLGSNINFIKKSNKMFCFKQIHSKNFEIISTKILISKISTGFNLGYSSIIYKAEILKNGPDLENLYTKFSKWHDRPFLIELSKNGMVAVTKEAFINYRVHTGQDSQINNFKGITNEGYNLLKFYSTELEKCGIKKPNIYLTDQSIISATSSAYDIPGFIDLITKFKKDKLFSYRKITLRGIYYIIRFLMRNAKN